jgi:hypothetical protein
VYRIQIAGLVILLHQNAQVACPIFCISMRYAGILRIPKLVANIARTL